MLILVAVVLLSFGTFVSASGEVVFPTHAYNCNHYEPPATSGENGSHGVIIKIYPRKSDMSSSYSGCQTVWMEQGEQWKRIRVTYFEGGDLKTLWFADEESPDGILCSYSDKRLAPGASPRCFAYEMVKNPWGSFPSGCVQAMKAGKPIRRNCSINENEL